MLDEFLLHECDDSGHPKGMVNLTKMQDLGRKELINGIKTKNWLVYGTDKSERLVLDTVQNYMKAMAPHIEGVDICQYDDVLEAEKSLNNHSKMWCRVLNFGRDAGRDQMSRISKAMQSHYSPLPQAKGVRKDHKPMDPEFGFPMRVMMDGKKGPNGPLANIQCHILRPVRKKLNDIVKTEVISTEELCHFIHEHNMRVDNQPEVRVQPRRAQKTPPLTRL